MFQRKAELEIAAIIVSCFAALTLLFACFLSGKAMVRRRIDCHCHGINRIDKIDSLYSSTSLFHPRQLDFFLCRKGSQLQIKDYTNLNDLLLDAEEQQIAGRLAGDIDNEITVGSFFCDVLHSKQIPKCDNNQLQHVHSSNGFSEPLL